MSTSRIFSFARINLLAIVASVVKKALPAMLKPQSVFKASATCASMGNEWMATHEHHSQTVILDSVLKKRRIFSPELRFPRLMELQNYSLTGLRIWLPAETVGL